MTALWAGHRVLQLVLALSVRLALCGCPTSELFRGDHVHASCFTDWDTGAEFVVVRSTGLPDHFLASDSLAVAQQWVITIPVNPAFQRHEAVQANPAGVVGVALNGVPFFAAPRALTDEEVLAEADGCLGFVDAPSLAYHYKTAPPCLFGSDRATYGLGSLLDGFAAGLPSPLVGLAVDGFPIHAPVDASGAPHAGLDACNGKVTNGSFGYFTTVEWPYVTGCLGPGPEFDTDPALVSRDHTYRPVDTSECPAGMFQSAGTNGCELCPPGRFGTTAGLTSATCSGQAGPGRFAPAGSTGPAFQLPKCPAGRYGATHGLTTAACDGECEQGWFCPEGSTTATAMPCGGVQWFCPAGSAQPLPVDEGHFTTVPETMGAAHRALPGAAGAVRRVKQAERQRTSQQLCEPGSYCVGGVPLACPAGRYGATPGLTDPECSGNCTPGHFCPERSVLPTPCPRGVWGGDAGLSDAQCSGLCEPGFWCPSGSVTPRAERCAAGRYGASAGLTTAACSLDCDGGVDERLCVPPVCAAGHWCPEASTVATQRQCGGSTVFCPPGSTRPTPVARGHYTVGPRSLPGEYQLASDAAVRVAQAQCEPGTFCVDGVKRPCPAGRYGDAFGLVDEQCSGPCAAGWFCPTQSVSPTQVDCGTPDVFCPEGSVVPTAVGRGNFTTQGPPANRAAQAVCPRGSYCEGGISRLCPAGRYSKTDGESDPACGGVCWPGWFCPIGSVDRKAFPCPAGRWGTAGMVNELCEGACRAGYFCPNASTTPTQTACGNELLFCPPGSGAPQNVSVGHYSTGGTVTTRTGQAECRAHTPPAGASLNGLCPSTTAPLAGPMAWYDSYYEAREFHRDVNSESVDLP